MVALSAAIALSLVQISNWTWIRDSIGRRYLEGYSTYRWQDWDPEVGPVGGIDATTAHWYSNLGLSLFQALYFGLCIGIPPLTWKGFGKRPDPLT